MFLFHINTLKPAYREIIGIYVLMYLYKSIFPIHCIFIINLECVMYFVGRYEYSWWEDKSK
jgi:hypothetical protein